MSSGSNVGWSASHGDSLDGRGGNDLLYGGPRNDRLIGCDGRDFVIGAGGTDTCDAERMRGCES